ncbi:MAG: hypothetical protein AB7D47_04345 [Desulfovibrio sp.]
MKAEFETNARLRRVFEDRWLQDLRQYKGLYEPEVEKEIAEGRSRVFLRKTKSKVDSIQARVLDLLFPAKGERNWDISPSSTPRVHPELFRDALARETAQGNVRDREDERRVLREVADEAATRMGKEMEDQLADGPGRTSYRTICDRLLFQGVLYGCGVLKGPLVERRRREQFVFCEETGEWELSVVQGEYWPFREFVSLWDVYPDLTAVEPGQLRFVWQMHLKTRKELFELADWPSFDRDAIRQYIADNPEGDAKLKEYEQRLRTLGEDNETPAELAGRYRVLERWGHLNGTELQAAGVAVEDETATYSANIWLLGDQVVKAVLSPIEGIDIPYHFFFYSEDESAFFPEGVASILRHPQAAFNAAVRMMLDNAAICAGPQIGCNASALHEDTDPYDVHPFKVWLFRNVQDLKQAFTVFDLPSNVNDLLGVAKLMADWADEQTTPRFMAGEGPTKGAAETASGLSMLMSAANIVLKSLVSQFDDYITRPFVTALYYWNMKFNPRREIKGDYVIKAIGSSALIARELQAERLQRAIAITDSPRFADRVKDQALLEDIFKLLDLDVNALRTEEEAEEHRLKRLRGEMQAQARTNVQALLQEAEERGMDAREALLKMLSTEMQQAEQPQGGMQDLAGLGIPNMAGLS